MAAATTLGPSVGLIMSARRLPDLPAASSSLGHKTVSQRCAQSCEEGLAKLAHPEQRTVRRLGKDAIGLQHIDPTDQVFKSLRAPRFAEWVKWKRRIMLAGHES